MNTAQTSSLAAAEPSLLPKIYAAGTRDDMAPPLLLEACIVFGGVAEVAKPSRASGSGWGGSHPRTARCCLQYRDERRRCATLCMLEHARPFQRCAGLFSPLVGEAQAQAEGRGGMISRTRLEAWAILGRT